MVFIKIIYGNLQAFDCNLFVKSKLKTPKLQSSDKILIRRFVEATANDASITVFLL